MGQFKKFKRQIFQREVLYTVTKVLEMLLKLVVDASLFVVKRILKKSKVENVSL